MHLLELRDHVRRLHAKAVHSVSISLLDATHKAKKKLANLHAKQYYPTLFRYHHFTSHHRDPTYL